jgi:hypothetical protein
MSPRPPEAKPDAKLDAQIDQLYQLPLEEFTSARNALAKEAGPAAANVKALQKPPLAAWAINQVYWRGRPAFHALTASAAAMRTAHTAVVSGKRGDLRAAGAAHEQALEAVLKAALAILRDAGHPATDATKQAIANTLRALPASTDPPGRLTQLLQPTGFELLAGLPTAARSSSGRATPEPAPAKTPQPEKAARGKDAARERALAKAKDALATAQRAERAADEHARREEFEAARAARDAERAVSALDKARAALESAQDAVAKADRDADEATGKRDAATRRVRESAGALAAAKVRTEAAQAAVKDI